LEREPQITVRVWQLVVKDGDHEATLVLDEKDREIAQFEGLSSFLPWAA